MLNMYIEDYMMENDMDHVIVITQYKCGHELKYCATYDDNILLETLDKYEKYETIEDYQITKKMIADKALILYVTSESKCVGCWNVSFITKIYCSECEHPTGFETINKYHGIAAFTGYTNMAHAINNLLNLYKHPEYEICCSSNKLNGQIGVEVDGDVIVASNMDLWTYIDPNNNKRYYEYDPFEKNPLAKTRRADYIITDASQLDSTIWDHNELVTTNIKIKNIWLKSNNDFTNEDIELLINTAKELNIEIVIIEA